MKKIQERAHPDAPGFKFPLQFVLRKGFLPWLRLRRKPAREALFWRYKIANRHTRGMRVLDVPCGMGWGTSMLRKASHVVGVDISDAAVEEARRRYGRRPSIQFMKGSMEALPFEKHSFDAIVCLEGIEHIPPELGPVFVRECARVLRVGGQLIISSPYTQDGAHSGNPYHYKEYNPSELHEMLEPHFEILHTGEQPHGPLTIHLAACKLRSPC